jgi:hypothetical protein
MHVMTFQFRACQGRATLARQDNDQHSFFLLLLLFLLLLFLLLLFLLPCSAICTEIIPMTIDASRLRSSPRKYNRASNGHHVFIDGRFT